MLSPYLPHISPISRPHLAHIFPISRPYLPCISQCGDDLVLSKQRAPIFEDDRGPQTLVRVRASVGVRVRASVRVKG